MSAQFYLTILTFLGLTIGFAGGLISQLTRTSKEDEHGKKVLTPAGRVAMMISILGFTGSFGSELIRTSAKIEADRQTDLDKKEKRRLALEEEEWRKRSSGLTSEIYANTKKQLAQNRINLEEMLTGFSDSQRSILETRLAIGEARQRVLTDNLLRETRLYGRLSATAAPLLRLTLRLTIEAPPRRLAKLVQDGAAHASEIFQSPEYVDLNEHHNVDGEDDVAMLRAETYRSAVMPVVGWLGTGNLSSKEGFLFVGFDEQISALSGVGWVAPEAWEESRTIEEFLDDQVPWLPSGMEVGADGLDWLNTRGDRGRRLPPQVTTAVARNALTLTIDIPQTSLATAIWRYSDAFLRTAVLPNDIYLISWTPTKEGAAPDVEAPVLPINSKKLHDSVVYLARHPNRPVTGHWPAALRLEVVPNGINEIGTFYELVPVASAEIFDGPRDDDYGGFVRIWHGRRGDPPRR